MHCLVEPIESRNKVVSSRRLCLLRAFDFRHWWRRPDNRIDERQRIRQRHDIQTSLGDQIRRRGQDRDSQEGHTQRRRDPDSDARQRATQRPYAFA